ncbi:hypothetical protein CRG98_035555 [Punica granatum]|uniref:Uncharacterized protein n=1 Tax=Punica granatum TaxID=22663 RepID=A0A2I0IJX9_PUNGR|nr:hypothetical protein CRG98_035555 [Punica granatum]
MERPTETPARSRMIRPPLKGTMHGNHTASREEELQGFGKAKEPHGPRRKGMAVGSLT